MIVAVPVFLSDKTIDTRLKSDKNHCNGFLGKSRAQNLL